MSDLDKELLKLYKRLQEMLDDIKKDSAHFESHDESPISIPGEIYDDMCDELGTDEIDLMGIS